MLREKRISIPSDENDESYSRSDAEEIWRLAAHLQAEAAKRLEDRSKILAGESEEELLTEARDFSLKEIKNIADDAGLGSEFVELALKEQAASSLLTNVPTEKQKSLASRVLGSTGDRISVTRVFQSDKQTVLEAMQRIFPADPYGLELIDIIGEEDKLADATLVFGVPQMDMAGVSGFGQTTSATKFTYNMTISDLNRMIVSLHALDENRTEVVIQLDTQYGQVRNMRWSLGITAFFALFSFTIAVVAGLGSEMGFVVATLAPTLLALLIALGTMKGYGLVYRNGLKKGKTEMEDLLRQIDVHIRTGGAFGKGVPTKDEPAGGKQ